MKLYELNEHIRNIIEHGFSVEAETGETWDFEDLEALQIALEEKLESTGCIIKELEAEAEALKTEAANLNKRRTSKINEAERLRGYIVHEMEKAGLDKLDATKCKIGIRTSRKVDIYDWDKLPERFTVEETTVKADKRLLAEALKDGNVPGAEFVYTRYMTVS